MLEDYAKAVLERETGAIVYVRNSLENIVQKVTVENYLVEQCMKILIGKLKADYEASIGMFFSRTLKVLLCIQSLHMMQLTTD